MEDDTTSASPEENKALVLKAFNTLWRQTMRLTGNTIFITVGGSGIGRSLAVALYKLGNKVIISGCRKSHLDAVVAANPGIEAVELDVADPASITKIANTLIAEHPALNVLINNADIMLLDSAAGAMEEKTLTSQIDTNLLGPIRLTAALIEHLKAQPVAWVIYNSSTLAFTPLAPFATYSATKAALHSYAMSQRFMLRETSVRVQEIDAGEPYEHAIAGGLDERAAVFDDRWIDEFAA
ncbi:MAG TPA: SDR family NAD(P)-dependent oxidoreductase [Steroidobacteraceae bacterium]|jgi:uncharacterized oxidoreductase